MDSYMPGGGGMLTTDIEASRWSKECVQTSFMIFGDWDQNLNGFMMFPSSSFMVLCFKMFGKEPVTRTGTFKMAATAPMLMES